MIWGDGKLKQRIEDLEHDVKLLHERMDEYEAMDIDDSICPVHGEQMSDMSIFGIQQWFCVKCNLPYEKRVSDG